MRYSWEPIGRTPVPGGQSNVPGTLRYQTYQCRDYVHELGGFDLFHGDRMPMCRR